MKVQLQAAFISLLVNLVASLLLMKAYGVIGLAWANLFAAFFQFFYLCLKNDDLSVGSFISQNQLCAHKILLASLCMYVVVFYGKNITGFGDGKLALLGQLSVLIIGGMVSYFLPLILSKFYLSEGKPLLFRANRK